MNIENSEQTVALVAILCDEESFLDEWILYHRMLGVDHFFLYDDGPDLPLQEYLKPHQEYVTVIPWHGNHAILPGRNRQTKAYSHAVKHYCPNFKWTTFIDGDEFIVLRAWENLKEFLKEFDDYDSISLNWHVFGHNGFFDDPKGLITFNLTRRMLNPNSNVKTITKTSTITEIYSAHFCRLKKGSIRVDANKRIFSDRLYTGKTEKAHINHYQCRSFLRWMRRVERGDVALEGEEVSLERNKWRLDEYKCLKQFVQTVALNKNEYVDNYMQKFAKTLEQIIGKLRNNSISNKGVKVG